MIKQFFLLLSLLLMISSCSKDNPVIPIAEVKLQTQELSIKIGSTANLIATILPENTTDDKKLTWSSADNNIATVNNGTVTAVNIGETIITVMAGTVTSKCIVKVLPIEVASISLNETNKEIKLGENFQLTANILPNNSTDTKLTWQSSNENIVKVNNGLITGVSLGIATISVKSSNGIQAKCDVKVLPIKVSGITTSNSSLEIVEGRSQKITYKISPENATNSSVTFKSSDENIFSIDRNGNINAKSVGTAQAIIQTVDGGFTSVCIVNVVPFTKELIVGFQISSFSNPGGYINFTGGVILSNYSVRTIYVKQFMVLDNSNTVISGKDINKNLLPENSLDYLNISISNTYKARAVFSISYNGKEYLIEKSIL